VTATAPLPSLEVLRLNLRGIVSQIEQASRQVQQHRWQTGDSMVSTMVDAANIGEVAGSLCAGAAAVRLAASALECLQREIDRRVAADGRA